MLKLELLPSSLANRLLFFMLARWIGGVTAVLVFLFVHFWAGVFLLVGYLLLSIGYYFYLHRLALAIFLLARSAQAAPEQPAGEARRAPAAVPAEPQ